MDILNHSLSRFELNSVQLRLGPLNYGYFYSNYFYSSQIKNVSNGRDGVGSFLWVSGFLI